MAVPIDMQADGNLVIKDREAIIWTAGDKQLHSVTLYPRRMREPLQFVVRSGAFRSIRIHIAFVRQLRVVLFKYHTAFSTAATGENYQ